MLTFEPENRKKYSRCQKTHSPSFWETNRHGTGLEYSLCYLFWIKKTQNKPYSFKNQENHYHYYHLEKENSGHRFLGHY